MHICIALGLQLHRAQLVCCMQATQGSPPLAGIRGTLVGPGYDNQGIAFCVLLIANE